MGWYVFIGGLVILFLMAFLDIERTKRKRLETVVAKLRDKQTLNEQEIETFMTAKKFDWQGNELPA